MRVVSLLPSLTEFVAELGRADWLVGISHECDAPASITHLPRLTSSLIDVSATASEIDAQVANSGGGSLYRLDSAGLESVRPDLILTQAQCDVCAVSEQAVRDISAQFTTRPMVEAVNPVDLAGVFTMCQRLGRQLEAEEAASRWIDHFERTASQMRDRVAGKSSRKVALIEWLDPPYSSGHWNPDLVSSLGSDEVLNRAGQASRRIPLDRLAEVDPDVLIVAPCGLHLDRVIADWNLVVRTEPWADLKAVREGKVVLVDGNAYFNRPGPRLEVSLRIVAAALVDVDASEWVPEPGWLQFEKDGVVVSR